MITLERVKTGIDGLDKALNGGFPEKNLVLLSGGAGTGKSTLAMQFLVNGAKMNERGLYISTEQTPEELKRMSVNFKWNLDDFEKKNLIKIVYFGATSGDHLLDQVTEHIKKFTPRRVVIDSLSTFTDAMLISEIKEDKPFSLINIANTVSPIPRTEKVITKLLLYRLILGLKELGVTAVLTTELREEENTLSTDGVSEFITDGVILLSYLGVGSAVFRNLRVRKMRYTDHLKESLAYNMTSNGVEVKQESSII